MPAALIRISSPIKVWLTHTNTYFDEQQADVVWGNAPDNVS